MRQKFLTMLIGLLFVSTAFANGRVKLQAGDKALRLIQTAEIVSMDWDFGNCPRGAHCQPRSKVKIKLTLGCGDRLGPVTANYEYADGGYKIFLTALAIDNIRSESIRCIAPNFQFVTMTGTPGMDKRNTQLVVAQNLLNKKRVVRPGACTREFRPVCGIKSRRCPPGMMCPAVMPAPRTYSNRCNMRADGARLLYEGRCRNNRRL